MTAETFITILSASGLILVTIANIFYNRHYRDAKQAEIDSLRQQIDTLKQLTSPEVLEHFKATKEMLEDKISRFEQVITQKDKEIAEAKFKRQLTQVRLLDMQKRHAEAMLELSTEVHNQVSDLSGSLVFQAFAPTVSTSPPPESDNKE